MASDTRDGHPNAALDELFDHAERVRLVDWASFSDAKTTVLLLSAFAVVSFITGLSHLSGGAETLNGPLASLFPGAQSLVLLYGVFFAFVIGVLTVGIQRRVKVAWYGVLVALPLAMLLPLLTADAIDVPLFLIGAVALPHAVRNRQHFDQALDLSPFQIASLTAFVGAQVYGTVGAYVMRDEFVGVGTLTDAFYYIIVTGTTVGYGDATPTTQVAKLFTLSVIVLATGSFTVATGSLLVPAIESRISNAFGIMNASELSLFEDHVLVLGYGEITEPLLDELVGTTDIVVVTEDTDSATKLREEGVNVLTADPTDADTLRDARVDSASGVVVATEDDARDVLAVLAARQENPDVRIVAAATNQKHVDKLDNVGADEVISPTIIGGQMLGQAVRRETGGEGEEQRDADDDEPDVDAGG
ncbi:potassium channel family protein [Halobacterium bonnevillei]|uniref:Potassium channel protein n=1 Tax=Halobacterium bonnevillei TaxID=2692200 RepID=A0A6B0SGE5_9EURY|nr:NAD-binding protein [Halobacterium bonnevillei]MXR19686.1 potassium channel protein [Halobacterium bonnevillei]